MCKIVTAVLVAIALLNPAVDAQQAGRKLTDEQKRVIKLFDDGVDAYVKLRERMEGELPKLPKEATPEQIQAHETALRELVQKSRATAKPGDVFRPEVAAYIRDTIKAEFKGHERKKLRVTVLEADTKGVPLKVNVPYPDAKELTQIPPTLLLELPQLPKRVKYRFVRRHMVLVDSENGLIIDFMLDALP
jgi:hypothetical protein